MFRDVDLSGCYARVMMSMSLYVGRPVVHDPGSGGMTLKDAVAFVAKYAAGWDAWIIKVSGKIAAWIAPPDRGINNLAVDYEYVRLP